MSAIIDTEGKVMLSELYWEFIYEMAKVMTVNKEKYPPKNHFEEMNPELLLEKANRHMIQIWMGVEKDPTDGFPHSVKVATNMMMYFYQKRLQEGETQLFHKNQ